MPSRPLFTICYTFGKMRNLPIMLCWLAVCRPGNAATSCDQLASVALPHTTISSAKPVDAGYFSAPGGNPVTLSSLPAFCRVTLSITPAEDSQIGVEVWLPAGPDWNGNLQSVGNGAWAGVISYSGLAAALDAGYAAASTDAGHTGNNASFIKDHPERFIDFGYRAAHEMTVTAKKIIEAYYGRAAKYSYWNGCSTGGRQAMAEVQHYPNDYDGVIAGAPVFDSSHIQGTQLWFWQVFHKDEDSNIPREKLILLHNAVIKSCDGLDGVKDGVLEDPTRCGFDPFDLLCKSDDAPNCLTRPQAEAAQQSYLGPTEAKTGRQLYPGREWGSELGWLNHSGPQPANYATDLYRYAVLGNPAWDYRLFSFNKDVPQAMKILKDTMDFTDPDLSRFFAHGGKLIQYHGWNDPGVPPQGSVNYYRAVTQAMGGVQTTDKSYRLFMVPGMGHCVGGDGITSFNMITALEQWVEEGRAPDWIPASKVVNGEVARTRPLCPYPQVAAYRGQGSTDEAPNFVCRVP